MFKRKTDPNEHMYLYSIPGVAAIGALLAAHMSGVPNIYQMGYLFSSLCCIGGISGLANQKTARVGNALGITGVVGGVITALASLHLSPAVFTQAIALIGVATALGGTMGYNVAVTDLPQTVAAFHALVGIAAVTTSFASLMMCPNPDGLHRVASFLGAGIGSITFSGSIVAYRKLSGMDCPDLPLTNVMNRPLGAANALGLYAIMASPAYWLGMLSLVDTAACMGLLGWNITNSIGSADMPVAITVLNSYSGWALCAEGFMLNNPMLTIVGSLIGSSGAILSYIMCKAMNRSLPNVIFGEYKSLSSAGGEAMVVEGVHQETHVDAVGEMLVNAKDVIIVPGYGLAAAQG